MAEKQGFKVPATIYPGHDDFPVADSNDVAGNIMYVETQEDLLTIPYRKRKVGMFVYVNTEGVHYRLVNNKISIDSTCWAQYALVSKDYVDNAILSALSGGSGGEGSGSPVDFSSFETAEHAANTYATKEELNTLSESVPRVITSTFDVPENPQYPLTFEFEIPDNSIGLNINASVEAEESGEEPEPSEPSEEPVVENAGVNFVDNPVTGTGLTTNEFGVALANSKVPTASDIVTYGE